MRFPNAFNGVKKIYTAEILAVIAAAALLIVALLGFGLKDIDVENIDAAQAGSVGGILILTLAAGVISIVSLIMMIVGLNQAKLDEPAFRTALILSVVSLVLAVVGTFVESSNEMAGSFISVATSVLSLASTIFIVKGIINLAEQLTRGDMVERGNTLIKIIIGVNIIGIVTGLIGAIIKVEENSTIAVILSLVSAIASIAALVIYLVYLSHAKKMLQE